MDCFIQMSSCLVFFLDVCTSATVLLLFDLYEFAIYNFASGVTC